MATLNKVYLIGNLTRDPELRVTPKGTAICQFGLAINRTYKDDSGSHEEVTFVDCEAWTKTAELIQKYCAKGAPVFVEGRLRLDQWEDKQTGQKRSRLKVVVDNVQFLGRRESAQAAPDNPDLPRDSEKTETRFVGTPNPSQSAAVDEDVPF